MTEEGNRRTPTADTDNALNNDMRTVEDDTTDTTSDPTTFQTRNSDNLKIITGVIGAVAAIALLLTVGTLLLVAHQKLRQSNSCEGNRVSPKDVVNRVCPADEPYVHYSLPTSFRTGGLQDLSELTTEGKWPTRTEDTTYARCAGIGHNLQGNCEYQSIKLEASDVSWDVQDSHTQIDTDLQVNESYNNHIVLGSLGEQKTSLQDKQGYLGHTSLSHHSTDLQDNQGYLGHKSLSHHSNDLQDNLSYRSCDLQGSNHSIDLQDNQSYHSYDPQRSYSHHDGIGLQDNQSYHSHDPQRSLSHHDGIDLQDNLSYHSHDLQQRGIDNQNYVKKGTCDLQNKGSYSSLGHLDKKSQDLNLEYNYSYGSTPEIIIGEPAA